MTELAPLASERIIINSPMSFAGSAQRAWRMLPDRGAERIMVGAAVIALILPIWWTLIIAWYIAFGLMLVPYRLLRRGARKRKAEALRHRELMASVERRP